MELIKINWIDAFSEARWMRVDEAEEWGEDPYIIESIGWVVKETEDYIVLAASASWSDDKVSSMTAIPVVCIKSREIIKS